MPAPEYGAQYCKVVAAKARNAADLLHLTLAALRSNADAQEAREVRVYAKTWSSQVQKRVLEY